MMAAPSQLWQCHSQLQSVFNLAEISAYSRMLAWAVLRLEADQAAQADCVYHCVWCLLLVCVCYIIEQNAIVQRTDRGKDAPAFV